MSYTREGGEGKSKRESEPHGSHTHRTQDALCSRIAQIEPVSSQPTRNRQFRRVHTDSCCWCSSSSRCCKGRFKRAVLFPKKSKVPNFWNLHAGVPPKFSKIFGTKLGPKNWRHLLPKLWKPIWSTSQLTLADSREGCDVCTTSAPQHRLSLIHI